MQDAILTLLKRKSLKPGEIASGLKISRQALHKHLRILLKERRIKKNGSGPHVSYSLPADVFAGRIREHYDNCCKKLLPQYRKHFSSHFKKHARTLTPKRAQKASGKPFDFGFMIESAAVYSSNIEGNTLNVNSFLNSRLTPKKHRPKEAQEIEDLIVAYHLSQQKPLQEKNMLRAHAILSKEFVSLSRQGVYRQEPVGVFSQYGVEYMAVEQQYVGHEMKELFKIVQELLQEKQGMLEGFFWASWIHLMIALIHPFRDGNGRTSRLCEKWFLAEKFGQQIYFLPSEEFYFKNRPDYYASLKLGMNYWETDLGRAMPFFKLLPMSLDSRLREDS